MRSHPIAARKIRTGATVKAAVIVVAVAAAIGRRVLRRPPRPGCPKGDTTQHGADRDGRAPSREGGAALVAVFIAFVPLAFSEDFLLATFGEEWPRLALLGTDTLLLAVIFWLTWNLQPKLLGARDWRLLAWWVGGAGLTLVVDAGITWDWVVRDIIAHRLGDVGLSVIELVLYLVSLTVLFAATVGVDPWRMLTRSGRAVHDDAWRRFRPAIPLLVGTFAAYIGSLIYWEQLDRGAMRSGCDLASCALRQGRTAEAVDAQCIGAVSQEYFAQLSQVIPLLLVAVGLEAGFFGRFLDEPVPRALAIFTFVILCVGEALAISALPEANQGCGELLFRMHEYAAFILTLEACFVALATLVWALVVAKPTEEDKPKEEDKRSTRAQVRH